MNFFIGTSGYSYPKWKGSFYPAKIPAKQMLSFYSSRFQSVEINSTFRSLPSASVLESWAEQVPGQFRFVLKAPQKITHIRRLKDADATVGAFLEVAGALKKRLGPLLFQLPPNFKKDLPRLIAFLALLPKGCRAAMEFRHPSWFDDEVFALLSKHKTALCIADTDGGPKIPIEATAQWGYVRLRKSNYSAAALKAWAVNLKAQPWRECFVFFKHEDEGKGPKMAARLMEIFQPDSTAPAKKHSAK